MLNKEIGSQLADLGFEDTISDIIRERQVAKGSNVSSRSFELLIQRSCEAVKSLRTGATYCQNPKHQKTMLNVATNLEGSIETVTKEMSSM